MTYQEVIRELEGLGITPVRESYYKYYEFDTPISSECEKVFRFGQDFLDREDLEFKVKPARIYFSTDSSLNAVARVREKIGLLEINVGTINWLKVFFQSKHLQLENVAFDKIRRITNGKGITVDYFLTQLMTIYCFYHETGHLIQRKLEDKNDYVEFLGGNLTTEEVRVRHIRELDADWYAVSCIAIHAGEFCEESEDFKEVAIMCLSGMHLFWLEQLKGVSLYYESNSHPHPFVRLTYMIAFFVLSFESVFIVTLEKDMLLSEVIERCKMLIENDERDNFEEQVSNLNDNLEEIKDYILTVVSNSEEYPYLSKKVVGK